MGKNGIIAFGINKEKSCNLLIGKVGVSDKNDR